MIDRNILQIVQTAVIEAVALSSNPDLPIKFLGRTFNIPDDQKYVELVWIVNNPPGDYWGTEKNYQGIFRLLLHWQNNDQGVYDPLDVLSSICSYFSKTRLLDGVQFLDNPNMMTVLEQGSEIIYPASIRYQYFQP